MNKYKSLSERYLKRARIYLKKKDYLQASEKYWVAAAETVKAYAENNKLYHKSHDGLFKVVEKIATKTNDEEFILLFSYANSLHINFYEKWLTEKQVKIYAKQVEKFIDKMNALI